MQNGNLPVTNKRKTQVLDVVVELGIIRWWDFVGTENCIGCPDVGIGQIKHNTCSGQIGQ